MKRYLKTITAVVLAALTTAACQKENFRDATPAGQEVDVTLDLLAPQIGTKSYGDGTTAKTVYVHVYQRNAAGDLTYIQPATEGASLKTPSQSLTLNGRKATYSTRLVTGQTYTFVFWAQADNAPYTYDTDAKTITVDYASAAGNDESRDAFYNVLPNVKIEGAYTASVQLSRPFAQLNFGAADYKEAKAAGLTVTDATVELTHAATSLNLLDGTTAGDVTVTFASAALPENAILTAGGKDYKYVAMDYVLVGKAAKTLSNVTLTLTATGTQSTTPEYTYSNVPLQANYRTNIVGNLFTSPAEVNITVDPAFETPDYGVVVGAANLAAANDAFAKGATAVTVEEIVSGDPDVIVLPKTSEGVAITLPQAPDGKSITIKYADTAVAGQKPQTLKVTAKNAASITIVAPDTHVEVNGVTVGTLTATTSGSTLVVGKDVKISTLNIEQGAAEIYGNVSNVLKGENAGIVTWYVDDAANFETALNNADKVVLTADIDLKSGVAVSHSAELNLNKHSIANIVDIWKNSNAVVNVDNCTLSIGGNGSVKAKAEDCYTFNVKNGGKLVINGGDFVGNVSVIQVEEGVAEVYGGNFSLAQTWPGTGPCGCDYMINMIDANYKAGKAKAVVKGGTFVGFNPGDCVAEGAHTDFVAEGYASVAASASPLTYEVEKCTAEVKSCSDLANLWADDNLKASYVLNIDNEMTIDKYLSPMNKTIKMALSKNAKMVANKNRTSVMTICYGSTLDLSGYGTFTGPSNKTSGNLNTAAIKTEKANLNIYGSLKFEGGSGNTTNNAVYVYSGTTNIYSGYFHAGLDKNGNANACILVDAWTSPSSSVKAYCNIYGGVFEADDPKYLLNINDDVREYCSLLVYGGTFVGFNPADNTAEGAHTNFVAKGYKSVKITYNGKDAWEVVPE